MNAFWTLVIIFSNVTYPRGNEPVVQHSGLSVPGFVSRQDCKAAGEILATEGSKWACIALRP
jgi:hypothetical protein